MVVTHMIHKFPLGLQGGWGRSRVSCTFLWWGAHGCAHVQAFMDIPKLPRVSIPPYRMSLGPSLGLYTLLRCPPDILCDCEAVSEDVTIDSNGIPSIFAATRNEDPIGVVPIGDDGADEWGHDAIDEETNDLEIVDDQADEAHFIDDGTDEESNDVEMIDEDIDEDATCEAPNGAEPIDGLAADATEIDVESSAEEADWAQIGTDLAKADLPLHPLPQFRKRLTAKTPVARAGALRQQAEEAPILPGCAAGLASYIFEGWPRRVFINFSI